MTFDVIDNPGFGPELKKFRARSGFKNSEFKMLAGLFSRAASARALYDIGVDVDFDEGVCTFTYFRTNNYQPYLQFVIRRVGPHTDMYELYREGKGRLVKSGLFARVYERLEAEVEALIAPSG